ncbi:MAG: SDR family NAD(P)-dependent oxidoreductase [Bradymonadaceae bacterium]|nr:SDR family NAD(P)-dependent oxidoreductase [Lujinxingiaceae bacterium]
MGLFDAKVALVTGAGGGLGRAYALMLASEGAKVVVNDLGGSRDGAGAGASMADAVVAEIRELGGEAVANYGSVADAASAQSMVDAALESFGRIDIVINNAGILRDKTLVKLEEELWDLVVDVHMKGTYLVTQAAVIAMQKSGHGGRIINTSSYAGLKGNFGQANYGAAKAGIAGFTRVVALETRKFGITVNAIAPLAKTRMTEDIAMIPDELEPGHIAPLVLWLASEAAAEVTGRVFGAHGSHYFEYRTEITPGVDLGQERWDIAKIGERFEEITQPAWEAKQAGGGADASGGDPPVRALFQALPSAFKAEKAKGWAAKIVFEVKGTGSFSLAVGEGQAVFSDGAIDGPDGKVTFDSADTLLQLAAGKLAAEQAFMAGKISANNMGVLMSFSKYFDLAAAGRVAAGGAAPAQAASAPGASGGASDALNAAASEPDGLNLAAVGKRFKHPAAFIRAEDIVAYAEATEDHNARYLDVQREGGVVASPIFAVKPLFAVLGEALVDKELNADLLRLVHGEQEMRFFKPLKPWDLVAPRGEIASIEEKSSGHLINVRQWLMVDGEVACEATSGLFVKKPRDGSREAAAAAATASSAGARMEAPLDERQMVYEESQVVAADQPLRYAQASGDHNPIHVDPDVARAAGLGDCILHGLCTMAFATKTFVNGVLAGDSTRLARIAVRFAKPVYPGKTLTTRVWKLSETHYGFETSNDDGVLVLSNGVVELNA